MRLPTLDNLKGRLPAKGFRPRFAFPLLRGPLRTLGPGSVASLLKIALDVAYVLLMLITAVLLIAFVAAIFIPISNYNVTVTDHDGGLQQPLTQPLLLFGSAPCRPGSAASC
jgi:hypothetical protein